MSENYSGSFNVVTLFLFGLIFVLLFLKRKKHSLYVFF